LFYLVHAVVKMDATQPGNIIVEFQGWSWCYTVALY